MKLRRLLFALAVGAVLTGCRTVPMTGRTQLMLSTQGTENAQGATAYGEYVSQNKISTNKRYTEALNRCGIALNVNYRSFKHCFCFGNSCCELVCLSLSEC